MKMQGSPKENTFVLAERRDFMALGSLGVIGFLYLTFWAAKHFFLESDACLHQVMGVFLFCGAILSLGFIILTGFKIEWKFTYPAELCITYSSWGITIRKTFHRIGRPAKVKISTSPWGGRYISYILNLRDEKSGKTLLIGRSWKLSEAVAIRKRLKAFLSSPPK
jgi:hypothetical protein